MDKLLRYIYILATADYYFLLGLEKPVFTQRQQQQSNEKKQIVHLKVYNILNLIEQLYTYIYTYIHKYTHILYTYIRKKKEIIIQQQHSEMAMLTTSGSIE